MSHVIDATWLQQHLSDPNLVLVDTRPLDAWRSGHLPGARHYDPGLFPLARTTPEAIKAFTAQVEWAFSALGIGADDHVVFYESATDVRAARAAWTLEYLGHAKVSVLDGGIDNAGIAATADLAAITPGRFRAAPVPRLLVSAEQVQSRDADTLVLDTRRQPDYLGSADKPRSGHIPGAVHRDASDNLDGAHYKPAAALRAELDALGLKTDQRIVVYCGGGGRASQSYHALRRAGFDDVGVYLASWNEWSARPELPVQAG